MKKSWIITLGLLFTVLVGCTSDDMSDISMNDSNTITVKSEKQLAIERYIDRNHKSATRGSEVPLLPYVVEGDTVMYVANYPEGGFEIFSNDLALPMVLVKSKTGFYSPYGKIEKTPVDEYLYNAAKAIAILMKDSIHEEMNMTWKRFTQSHTNKGTRSECYVGQAAEINVKEYTPRGGRLTTKWIKESPYNQYTPFFRNSTEHSLVGCGGIAMGQYLFHSHKYFNVPISTVTTAIYNSDSNTYSFSGSSSSVWNTMPDKTSNLTEARPIAVFLGHIAKEMQTKFGQNSGDGSSTYSEDYPSVLYAQCGYVSNWVNFSTASLYAILSEGHPAICTARVDVYNYDGTKEFTGHAFLIDYASFTHVTYYDVYANKSGSNIDDQDDNDSDNCYGWPLAYFREKYGEISTNYIGVSTEHWISMNWGVG